MKKFNRILCLSFFMAMLCMNLNAIQVQAAESILHDATSSSSLRILLEVGEYRQLSLTYSLPDGSHFIWTSSDPSVVAVDLVGIVTGVGEGVASVLVESTDGTFSDNVFIMVICMEEKAEDLQLALHIGVGETIRLWFGDNPLAVNWISVDESVLVVDSMGRVTGVGSGLAAINAQLNGVMEYLYIRVSS